MLTWTCIIPTPCFKEPWDVKAFIRVEAIWIMGLYLKEWAKKKTKPSKSVSGANGVLALVGNARRHQECLQNVCRLLLPFALGEVQQSPPGTVLLQQGVAPGTGAWSMAVKGQSQPRHTFILLNLQLPGLENLFYGEEQLLGPWGGWLLTGTNRNGVQKTPE